MARKDGSEGEGGLVDKLKRCSRLQGLDLEEVEKEALRRKVPNSDAVDSKFLDNLLDRPVPPSIPPPARELILENPRLIEVLDLLGRRGASRSSSFRGEGS